MNSKTTEPISIKVFFFNAIFSPQLYDVDRNFIYVKSFRSIVKKNISNRLHRFNVGNFGTSARPLNLNGFRSNFGKIIFSTR